ncbi:MAG: CPBP family intramembrane metalloprotease, partial [Clostridia bacterium]|nr:CPBP family intramembrane metalloprotease [Clostridia bacterium]
YEQTIKKFFLCFIFNFITFRCSTAIRMDSRVFLIINSFEQFLYPMSIRNIVGQMSFQLLLSGPSEELIFRAFAITMLARVVKGRVFRGRVSLASIIAAVIFGLAHVHSSFAPFKISYTLFQVFYAMVLGLFMETVVATFLT